MLHQASKRSVFLMCFTLLAFSPSCYAGNTETQLERKGRGDAEMGRQLSNSERCQECHGSDGNSGDPRIPNHAGQYASYLIKQLRNFQSGERQHETMSVMAEGLSEQDMSNIAAYFASQDVMHGDSSTIDLAAKALFIQGDAARGIKACANCHGENGKGRVADNITYPVIGGQRSVYLRSQLVSWKLGERTNSPDDVMNKMAQALTDEEIVALANYISGL
jgi:cytochrome c553